MSDLAAPLEDVGKDDVLLVGGKGASLGEMVRLGLPVPPGFVVTTSAFRKVLAELDPAGETAAAIAGLDPHDHRAVEAAAAGLRRAIETCPLPANLAQEILERYRSLGGGREGGAVPVAVRSSATGEDGLDASFAGLQDTFLWVRDEETLLDRLRACWSSLYSVESVCYRLQRRIAEEDAAMAVVVQQMVEARSSGVMFTRSPSTGDRSVVAVESAWGLGSAVVGGEVTPDSFTVSKVTGEVLRRQISTKARRHVPDPDGGGVLDEEVPEDLRHVPSIADDELSELLELARAVEAHYGVAQDVEWAIAVGAAEGDRPFLLQSRPETAWAKKQATEPIAAPKARAFDHVIEAMGRA